MNNRPFFSIIIPVYNAGEYLRECLECILAQTFEDWETVLVDDGSTDSSADIAEEFHNRHHQIKVYRSERNSGRAYGPRLKAASLSTGKYIVTVDADDKVSDNLLESLHNQIALSGADLVIPEMWDLKGTSVKKILPAESIDTSKTWNGKDLVKHTLCDWDIPMAGFAIRSEIYLRADGMLSALDKKSIFSDELLSRWLLFLCGSVCFSEARYYYRQNEESVTHTDMSRYTDSRMLTCDSLIEMTESAFGKESDTYLKAMENKFFTAVGLLRMTNRTSMKGEDRQFAIQRISSGMEGFDTSMLKGRISPRYLALMRLPIPLARMALKIIDPIINLKNGIRQFI